jgi:hypothetical protein
MRRMGMTFSVFVKLTVAMFGLAALFALGADHYVSSLASYFAQLMGPLLVISVLEGSVGPWMRRRLGIRGRSGSGSRSSYSSDSSYSGDGSVGAGSDCGWSDSGGGDSGGDSGGGDSGGSC